MIASKSWGSFHKDDCRRLKIEIHAGLSEAHTALNAALVYYVEHPEEIEQYIREHAMAEQDTIASSMDRGRPSA